ncbi:MAG: glucosidase [Chloroflexi bacterium]|nr:glucosidase [Chloroflexota bacterium]
MTNYQTAEHKRLAASEARKADWKNWGPYVSDRAWGTVREDYSASGEAWDYFDFWQAHRRAYRWNEDGIGGVCNRLQNICLALAFWNEQDPILKERFFGLTGSQGNHGEDVKEYYYYLDSAPTHSYMKMLYKYPQVRFPYEQLVEENGRRRKDQPEFELIDVLGDVFRDGRYFDITIEYAKADEEDILCRVTAVNRGPDPAPLHILPHIWFRNDWSWGYEREKPELRQIDDGAIVSHHRHLGERWWYVADTPNLYFTENESNMESLFGVPNPSPYVKDGIHEAVVNGRAHQTNSQKTGSKAAAHYQFNIPPGESVEVHIRFTTVAQREPFADFTAVFEQRIEEANAFYDTLAPTHFSEDERRVQRQAFAGLMWSKQFYHYAVDLWLQGDPASLSPPEQRQHGRNRDWTHLYNLDVLSMPDKWEYPWFAAWDLAFHTLPIAMIDPEWAKRQLILLLREWYMHPNGQIPAYEWAFGDVNPPVHAWACYRVYQITRDQTGQADLEFLEKVFHKLLLNFTWWVNRKDADGNNVFQGGFLGLDNIGVFDRSQPLPEGLHLDQADGTAWMGMYCLNMLAIALELARHKPAYEDVATKFFEHFIFIANAINAPCTEGGLWDDEDGFYYDMIHHRDGRHTPLRLRSFVGLIPLFAVHTFDPQIMTQLPRFARRTRWFMQYRPQLMTQLNFMQKRGQNGRLMLSLLSPDKLQRISQRMFDPAQFLSNYGLRSLSQEYAERPYQIQESGQTYTVDYQPAESNTYLFGGNSNWRGPIWLPLNYLMVESLQKYHHYFGDDFQVEYPAHSGQMMTLGAAAQNISQRLCDIFLRREGGKRPFNGGVDLFQQDPHWRDHILFYEYFHGDNGAGIGASHQTGWTAVVAHLLLNSGEEPT